MNEHSPMFRLPLAPLKTERAFERICSEIKRLIFKGVLKPGDRLPPETELARRFNVGRQTVREALRLLELAGFITIQKGCAGGPVIEDTILNTISNSIFDAIYMKKITVEELTVARLEIEKAMLKHAVEEITPEDLQGLQKTINQAKEHAEIGIHPFKDNIEFHKSLAKASKNKMFVILVDALMAVVADFLSRLQPDFEISRKVIYEHERILDALKRRKLEEADALLEDHILEVGRRFQDIVTELMKKDMYFY